MNLHLIQALLLLPLVFCNASVSLYEPFELFGLRRNSRLVCDIGPSNGSQAILTGKISEAQKREEKEPTKPIESFDEWTKKTTGCSPFAGDSQREKHRIESAADGESSRGTFQELCQQGMWRQSHFFESESENAKAVVNDKDVDDYLRNPCEQAKEKFIVIELCESIQIQKVSIANFELFSSRPKDVMFFIAERFPPTEWTSLGSFELQDIRKIQSFNVPDINQYAKFVKITFNSHYGKEHYCIVSVVNVMGTTIADEYEKEEAAVRMISTHDVVPPVQKETFKPQEPVENQQIEPKSTIIESSTEFQPVLEKKEENDRRKPVYWMSLRKWFNRCMQCPLVKSNTTHVCLAVCRLFNIDQEKGFMSSNTTIRQKFTLKQAKRRLKSAYQRFSVMKIRNNTSETPKPVQNDSKVEKKEEKNETEKVVEPVVVETPANGSTKKMTFLKKNSKEIPEPVTPNGAASNEGTVLPGAAFNNRESILMKLSKRIASVELNLTLSTEYLSELSKQYVNQMNGYKKELSKSHRLASETARNSEILMRSRVNRLRREVQDLKRAFSIIRLTKLENDELFDLVKFTRRGYDESCFSKPQGGGKKLIDPMISYTPNWNTDQVIGALIVSNMLALILPFIFYFCISSRMSHALKTQEERLREDSGRRLKAVKAVQQRLLLKGIRKAEAAIALLAHTQTGTSKELNAAICAALNAQNTTMKELFASQDDRIFEQFAAQQVVLKRILEAVEVVRRPEMALDLENVGEGTDDEHVDGDSDSVSTA
ncbi:unnamed protein product [Caenorhabditis auriculariae]|uniref:SUN domain-containing protein n=1 Tax=Caenorhabditis auriculariae TaxID=2777116 RepID=A0A8S1HPA7_9PELO|nr:unnamed protein product [Caenorhabditis auriculariae]